MSTPETAHTTAHTEPVGLDESSMGTSGDHETAITEGATVVRVGQAVFGARPTPGSHYWPGCRPFQATALSSSETIVFSASSLSSRTAKEVAHSPPWSSRPASGVNPKVE